MESIDKTFAHTVKDLKVAHKKSEGPLGQKVAEVAHQKNEVKQNESATQQLKKQLNESILTANLTVSVNAANEPMSLLFKAAIDGINEVLKESLGENAIQNAADSGLDVSPEATADRIVTMSTGYFSQYRGQHIEVSDEEAARSFAELIGSGIDKGFAEAREILGGLKVLEGDIAANIDTTYDLVQDGLQDFVDYFIKSEE